MFFHRPLAILRRHESRDGTVKFLFGLADGKSIESVLNSGKESTDAVHLDSSGLRLRLRLLRHRRCLGFKRNLTCGEIVEQILEANRTLADERRITNVVLMGMGEPLGELCADAARPRDHDRRGVGIGDFAAEDYRFHRRSGAADPKADGRDQCHSGDLAARGHRRVARAIDAGQSQVLAASS